MRSVHALQSYVSPENYSRHETTKTKRTTGATDGPKSLKGFSLAIALRCQLTARRLAGCCAGLMLALHWPSGPWPLGRWPSDTGPVGRWLPSALVAFGARRFRLGTVRETRSINRRKFNSRSDE